MKFRHTWKGDGDLVKTFKAMSNAVSRPVMVEALTRSAEPIRATAAALAPRGEGSGPHLADNIVVGETGFGANGNTVASDLVTVAIGPSHQPHDMFYGQFQEFGTAHHPAQPFMRPAFDQKHGESRKRFAAELRDAIARRVQRRPT
jgi:HK97 gp10 family phage protein